MLTFSCFFFAKEKDEAVQQRIPSLGAAIGA